MKFYAGIGSRATPNDVLDIMTSLAAKLEIDGWVLRSGGAAGADSAFERGVKDPANKQIFLPWRGFNGSDSPLCELTREAYDMARAHHPNWDACSTVARKFHARNSYQVMGPTLTDPSRMVVCWTVNALMAGGTGQALRIAQHHGIEICNLADDKVRRRVEEYIA